MQGKHGAAREHTAQHQTYFNTKKGKLRGSVKVSVGCIQQPPQAPSGAQRLEHGRKGSKESDVLCRSQLYLMADIMSCSQHLNPRTETSICASTAAIVLGLQRQALLF
jgi:hypothetical protein